MYGIKILLVEDEERLRQIVAKYLKREGYIVLEVEDGRQALERWEEQNINLIILDVMLPEYDGWTVCRKIRENSDVPIIMLTARSDESDKIFGFELGVDQYVTKPFSIKELIARVKALLKKHNKNAVKEKVKFDDLIINKKAHQVIYKDNLLDLSPKEYDLLLYFTDNINRALTREMILDKVWGYDYFGDLRTVDTHVKRLRKKLGEATAKIETVRGIGYRFEVDV